MVSSFSRCRSAVYGLIAFTLVSCGQNGGLGPGDSSDRPKYMFVTAKRVTGAFGGASYADDLCNSDANRPADGVYKSIVVGGRSLRRACMTANCESGTLEGYEWVLQPDTVYMRPDGTVIGKTTPTAILPTILENSISAEKDVFVWTGIRKDWTNSIHENCYLWEHDSQGVPGQAGDAGRIGGLSSVSDFYGQTYSCHNQFGIICAEQ